MKLIVNGEEHMQAENGTIDSLIEELGAQKDHTALMLNGEVIPAEKWSTTALSENDQIEMLVFVGGG